MVLYPHGCARFCGPIGCGYILLRTHSGLEGDSMSNTLRCPACGWFCRPEHVTPNKDYYCPHCFNASKVWRTLVRVQRAISQDTPVVIDSTTAGQAGHGTSKAVIVLADEFKTDIENLLSLGVKIDRGTEVAQVGGVAGAAGAYCFGHPVLAIIFGGLALIADSIAEKEKRIRALSVRDKWLGISYRLGREGTAQLAWEIQRRYPGLAETTMVLLPPS